MFPYIYPLSDGKDQVFNTLGYVMIEEQPIPDIHAEFAPGPSNEEEARFWNTAVTVYFITFPDGNPKIEEGDYNMMKKNYQYIFGRAARIHYWQVMKHLKP